MEGSTSGDGCVWNICTEILRSSYLTSTKYRKRRGRRSAQLRRSTACRMTTLLITGSPNPNFRECIRPILCGHQLRSVFIRLPRSFNSNHVKSKVGDLAAELKCCGDETESAVDGARRTPFERRWVMNK